MAAERSQVQGRVALVHRSGRGEETRGDGATNELTMKGTRARDGLMRPPVCLVRNGTGEEPDAAPGTHPLHSCPLPNSRRPPRSTHVEQTRLACGSRAYTLAPRLASASQQPPCPPHAAQCSAVSPAAPLPGATARAVLASTGRCARSASTSAPALTSASQTAAWPDRPARCSAVNLIEHIRGYRQVRRALALA